MVVPDDPGGRQGLRCIGYDLRGAGRSDQLGHGYDPDTLARDLAAVLQQLNLEQVTLVGHSMGSAQIVRYLARHHADRDRVTRAVFVATTLPLKRKTDDNPDGDGMDGAVFEETLAAVSEDCPRFAAGVADLWFGNRLPGVAVSPELQQWLIGLFLQAFPRGCHRDVPGVHPHRLPRRPGRRGGADPDHPRRQRRDEPLLVSARRTAAAILHRQLKLYQHASHGLFVSHRHRRNADLLEFIKR